MKGEWGRARGPCTVKSRVQRGQGGGSLYSEVPQGAEPRRGPRPEEWPCTAKSNVRMSHRSPSKTLSLECETKYLASFTLKVSFEL